MSCARLDSWSLSASAIVSDSLQSEEAERFAASGSGTLTVGGWLVDATASTRLLAGSVDSWDSCAVLADVSEAPAPIATM